jgi:hypothetical protein
MPVAWSQILNAFEFVSMSVDFGHAAWVCRETGAIHMHSDWDDELEVLPEDIDDAQKYVALPTPRDLDLGRPLVMRFAAERLSDRYEEIASSFPARAPIGDSRIFSSASALWRAGTPTRPRRRKKRCASGAPRTTSTWRCEEAEPP